MAKTKKKTIKTKNSANQKSKKVKVKQKAGYKISLKDLLEAGCHFGHQARRWNPKMDEYIFVKREGVHIFDLEITARKLEEAMSFVRDLVKEGKEIVFVGTKRQASTIIKEEAEKCGAPYVSKRWLGGTITNWDQIKKRIDLLKDQIEKKKKGEFKKYTKKENILIDRDIARLTRFLGGLKNLSKIPEAVFVVDVKKEHAVIKEGKIKEVKVVGVVDTNSDPDNVDFVIPVNDDAVSSIAFVVSKIAKAYSDGKNLRK
ncbi:MAG: 30S ribosomal protein S2 [Patescibacteria group bacterium]|nr:30S ribosomal protein S2 [Patescibacteria group bacterium]